jgi:glutathione S-transferase
MERLLYQFPISHYCEKIRWAMDHKGLDYKLKNLFPGPHVITAKRMAKHTSLPILNDGGNNIQNSNKILTYLDNNYPDKSLTPTDPVLLERALEWERYCDQEVGVHLRRFSYYYLLPNPHLVIPFFTVNAPWWGPLFFKLFYKKFAATMRKMMFIDKQGMKESEVRLQNAIDKLYDAYQNSDYLVGDCFSRADLAAAALLAPLIKPVQYGLKWPEQMPAELEAFSEKNKVKLERIERLYGEYR